jgi:hypothetical protein
VATSVVRFVLSLVARFAPVFVDCQTQVAAHLGGLARVVAGKTRDQDSLSFEIQGNFEWSSPAFAATAENTINVLLGTMHSRLLLPTVHLLLHHSSKKVACCCHELLIAGSRTGVVGGRSGKESAGHGSTRPTSAYSKARATGVATKEDLQLGGMQVLD